MRKYLLASLLAFWLPPAQSEVITLSAATSLTNAFREIADLFEQANPEHKVQLNFAGSGVLLQQIARGAPVDVFASADQVTMDQAEQQNLLAASSRRNFVSNTLVVITPRAGLPIQQLDQLLLPPFERVAISNPASVPVGRYTQAALTELQLWEPLQSKIIQTQNVRQSLDYVARDEVDAGFVYFTDAALMADKVSVQLEIPTPTPVLYPVAVTAEGANNPASALLFDFLFSKASQDVFTRYGFGPVN